MGSVLTMEQGAILQHQLPLPSEYTLTPDHDCIDQYPAHSHHPAYTTAGAVDQLRRDGTLPQPTLTFTATNNPHGARFVSDGGVTSDGSSFRAGYNFTDSSSGSISTSPSSAASSLAHNTKYQQNHYTSLPTFGSAVQLPQAFAYAPGPRVPSILEGSTATIHQPFHHLRSPIVGTSNAGDREAHAYSTPFLAQPQLSSSGYTSYTDTPRSVNSLGLALSPGSLAYPHAAHMVNSTSQGYGGSQAECANFPWPNLEVVLEMTCEGQGVTPEIHAKVEKGFFLSTVDNKWTCYRRNYFSVQCSFELHPNINNGRMYLKRTTNASEREQVQAMGMRLSAAVDGSNGKNIELVQHTPKRDNGPKSKIEVTKVSPMPSSGRNDQHVSSHGGYNVSMSTFTPTGSVPGPYLPLQHSTEPGSASSSSASSTISSSYAPYGSPMPIPGQSTTHTFERVQFKQATANNGKRRASQQYFHLILELFADVRKAGSGQPVWVKVAQRGSDKIVVRGRSPSHYQNEGQHGQAGRGSGASGGGGGYSTTGGVSYSGLNPGGFRSSTGGYGSLSSGANGYRSHHYGAYHHSSGDSASTPESVEGGAVDLDNPMDAVMTDADRAGVQEHDGYQYYPSTIYETIPPQLPLPKVESSAHRYSTEPRQYAVKAEYADAVPGSQWQVGGCGRFQGVESSRGFFPDLSAGGGGYS